MVLKSDLATRAATAVLWRAVQHGGVEAIYFIRLLVLARLLVPEDFGLVAIGVAAVGVLSNLSNLGMVQAIVQLANADARHFDAAWTIGVLRGLFIASVMFVAAPSVATLFGEPRAADLIRVIALRPLIEAACSIGVARLTRELSFRSIAAIRLPAAVIDAVVAISLAQWLGPWALVTGMLSGALAMLALSYLVAPYRPRISLGSVAVLPLIRFGRWIFLGGILGVASGTLIQLVISRELGTAALGLYTLGLSLAFMPSQLATQVIGEVAFPVYSRIQDAREQAARVFRHTFTAMAAVLFPVYALIFALAPVLTEEVLGPKWAGTAPVIRVISLVGMIGLFGDAALPLLQGLGRPDKAVWLGVVRTALIVSFVWVLADQYGVVGAAFAWVPAIAVCQLMVAVFAARLVPKPLVGLPLMVLVVALISALAAWIAHELSATMSGLLGLILGATAGGVTACALLWSADRLLGLGIWQAWSTMLLPFADRMRRARPSETAT